jgi:hypothetical protein
LAGNSGQGGIELHADNLSKAVFSSEEHASSHARSKIDERIFVERSHLRTSPPTADKSAKERRSDAVIGRIVPVVAMPAAQEPPRDQPAGSDSVLEVERMTLESLFDGQPWQKTPARFLDIRNC